MNVGGVVANQHWLLNLARAAVSSTAWMLDYNRARPSRSLGYLTPNEFAVYLSGKPAGRNEAFSHSIRLRRILRVPS